MKSIRNKTLTGEVILFKRNQSLNGIFCSAYRLHVPGRVCCTLISSVYFPLLVVANTCLILIQLKLDHLEMSGMNESKSSLKADSPIQEKRGFHVLIAKWEESPERNKFHELWEKHSLSIILLCLTVLLVGYSIAAIIVSGFDKAKWLFAITMFLWFCMTYMFIRNNCGSEIYQVVLQPIINAVNSKWKYLRW